MTERTAFIDVDAIAHNVRAVASAIGPTPIMAVVKADGYGHGAVVAARAALQGGAAAIGVAHVSEALALRQAGISAPMLAWLHTPETDFAGAIRAQVDLGVSGPEVPLIVDAAKRAGAPATVHLKFDSGMGRNGATLDTWLALVRAIASARENGRVAVGGYFTHLACADDLSRAHTTTAQHDRFQRAIGLALDHLPAAPRHMANTAATLSRPDLHLDMVRLGLGMYGMSPFGADLPATGGSIDLRPAMTFVSSLALVKHVPAGTGISYGHISITERASILGLVPVGYGDGIPRSAVGAHVWIRDRLYPVVGRVSMDQLVVDLTPVAGASPLDIPRWGDEVVLFGSPSAGHPSATDWGRAAGTIDYEIVTRISTRVQRVVVGGQSKAAATALR